MGFGWTVRVVALIQLVTLAIPNIVMRSRLPPRKAGPLIEPKAFLQPSYTLYTIGAFLIFWGVYTPIVYSALYAEKVNAPANISRYILSIMNVLDYNAYYRLLLSLDEYYPILLQIWRAQSTFRLSLASSRGSFCLAGSELQHGRAFLLLPFSMGFFQGRPLV
jgi:hypothetical protein